MHYIHGLFGHTLLPLTGDPPQLFLHPQIWVVTIEEDKLTSVDLVQIIELEQKSP